VACAGTKINIKAVGEDLCADGLLILENNYFKPDPKQIAACRLQPCIQKTC
jgi:hypothetical protein